MESRLSTSVTKENNVSWLWFYEKILLLPLPQSFWGRFVSSSHDTTCWLWNVWLFLFRSFNFRRIRYPQESATKSTAIHAKILAPETVHLREFPNIPDYNVDETLLLYPSEVCVTDFVGFFNAKLKGVSFRQRYS